jgi:nicotinamide-nucleotide amidase
VASPEPGVLATLHAWLQANHATVAVAESLTGGLLTAALTTTPGASASVRGGLVVYATDLKATLAGVDPGLLAARGAVDPEVATALAFGVRDRLAATYGLGVTGVAGPDPQDGQPVGTVHAAVAGPQAALLVRSLMLRGSRDDIRESAVIACVDLLAEFMGLPDRYVR